MRARLRHEWACPVYDAAASLDTEYLLLVKSNGCWTAKSTNVFGLPERAKGCIRFRDYVLPP